MTIKKKSTLFYVQSNHKNFGWSFEKVFQAIMVDNVTWDMIIVYQEFQAVLDLQIPPQYIKVYQVQKSLFSGFVFGSNFYPRNGVV